MPTEYDVDEFLGKNEPTTYETEVEKKVSLLYDFCILHKRKYQKPDEREDAVRKLLKSYGSPIIMDNEVHDILVGKTELDDTLKRKGFLN
jgi:uncharacterized protein YqgQ